MKHILASGFTLRAEKFVISAFCLISRAASGLKPSQRTPVHLAWHFAPVIYSLIQLLPKAYEAAGPVFGTRSGLKHTLQTPKYFAKFFCYCIFCYRVRVLEVESSVKVKFILIILSHKYFMSIFCTWFVYFFVWICVVSIIYLHIPGLKTKRWCIHAGSSCKASRVLNTC